MFEYDRGVRFEQDGLEMSPGQGMDLLEFGWSTMQWKGQASWRSGAVFGKPFARQGKGILAKSSQGLKGMGGVLKGWFVFAPIDIGISAGMAPKGYMAASGLGAGIANISSGLAAIAGAAVAGPLGAAVAAYSADSLVRGKATRLLYNFSQLDHDRRSLKMGGGYRDSQMAYTMRQAASREIGRSILGARQYLGKEASLMAD